MLDLADADLDRIVHHINHGCDLIAARQLAALERAYKVAVFDEEQQVICMIYAGKPEEKKSKKVSFSPDMTLDDLGL